MLPSSQQVRRFDRESFRYACQNNYAGISLPALDSPDIGKVNFS